MLFLGVWVAISGFGWVCCLWEVLVFGLVDSGWVFIVVCCLGLAAVIINSVVYCLPGIKMFTRIVVDLIT